MKYYRPIKQEQQFGKVWIYKLEHFVIELRTLLEVNNLENKKEDLETRH